MHFRYSWTRSMSSCCQRQSSCGTSVGRRERLDRLVDLVVPGHVGDEVADEREGAHRLDGDRLVEVEVGQARLAGQARPAVDLGAARAALGRLAVPADREVGRLVALDPVEGVEDDHPLLDRARRTRRSGPPRRGCRGRPSGGRRASILRRQWSLRRAGRAARRASSGSGVVVDASSCRRRRAATTLLRPPQRRRRRSPGSRAGCGRRGSRSAGGRCGRSPRRRSAGCRARRRGSSPGCRRGRRSTADARPARRAARPARSIASSRSASIRKMPTRRCIVVLEVALERVRVLAARSARAAPRARATARLDLDRIDVRLGRAWPPRAPPPPAPVRGPEHEQVRQRVAAEPVRAVHPAGDLARREQARARSSRPVSASTRMPPIT